MMKNYFLDKKIKQNSAGFTLIETIVAMSVITVGVISSLTLITNSVRLSSDIGDRLLAANLAAEGIEIVRNIRDNNWIQNSSWNNGLNNGDYNAAYNSLSLFSFFDTPLRLNPSSGIYDYSLSGGAMVFKRKISILNVSNSEIQVLSIVTWQRKNKSYSLSVEDHLFNWK